MVKYKFIAVDIQNDFASVGGKYYTPKPSLEFLKTELFPWIREKGMKMAEIISDYRPPRPGDRGDCCHPGEWGYESLVPGDLVDSRWIKCMNSPVWVRENIGIAEKTPGLPYPDTEGFRRWLENAAGRPEEVVPVLIGLTIDCCVLSTIQELSWRGYFPLVLREAVDHANGKIEDRDKILADPVANWGEAISWDDLKKKI